MMSAGVFAKLVVLVLAVGGSAVGMLALRQSRLQAAHEAAEARLRMRAHAERLMDLRAEVARRVTPEALAPFAADAAYVPAIEARHGPGAIGPEREPAGTRAPGDVHP
jgi:hypothetical protein